MSLELLRWQAPPFDGLADISRSLKQRCGYDDRAGNFPTQSFEALGDIHGVADDGELPEPFATERPCKNFAIMRTDANGDR